MVIWITLRWVRITAGLRLRFCMGRDIGFAGVGRVVPYAYVLPGV